MPPKKSLQQLLEIARTRVDEVARSLGASCTREQEELSKLRLLLHYREEYVVRFGEASRAGLKRGAWTNYYEFMQKLDSAIGQQNELLDRHRGEVERLRAAWHAASGKLRSFATLDSRRKQAEHALEQRREQKEQDELALRRPRG